MSYFPENLSLLRRRAGYTQESLAEALNVSRQAVSKWESGQTMPEADKLLARADLLGCTLDQLMREAPARESRAGADVPGTVARAILSFSENKIVILMLINVLLLIVGTFMEALAAIVILVPILLPIVTGVGVSPLHFGVIIVVNLAIGFITPPVGVNLFVASGVAKAKLENIASQALPMIALMLIVLLICTYIPEVPLILVGGPH